MKRLNNRGVSLIEILIAVVIFALCVTPIIAQLASSIRIGQRADDQQAATDYGRSVVETLKQTNLDSLLGTTEGQTQFADTLQMNTSPTVARKYSTIRADGSEGNLIVNGTSNAGVPFSTVTQMYQYLNAQNKSRSEDQQEALVRSVTINGTARIDYRDYDVKIEMDTKPYALASLNPGTSYVDPNEVNLGNLSSLDSSTTAVIPSISNYDTVAAAADFNNVVSVLENSNDPMAVDLAAQIKIGNRPLNTGGRELGTRKVILVTITKLAVADANGNKYRVTCEITYTTPAFSYTDNNGNSHTYSESALNTTYVAYEQFFKAMPEVYLLYNQFLYYNVYGNDLIRIDNKSDELAKVYVVRTAETDAAVRSAVSVGGTGDPEDADGTGGADGSGVPDGTGGTSGSGSSTPTGLLPYADAGRDNKKDNVHYDCMTNFELLQSGTAHPVAIYTNIPLEQGDSAATNISSSTDAPNDSTCKMSINVPASDIRNYVFSMQEDERYSEQGREYNIVITLTNKKTGNVTTFDTSKGDY
ncbi:MAG: prepilin-type N-terminal cleavage/methylation domain-containing protein [Bacteroides sp.]|nr:prepilin-type N-terminal cleavage/methylation domain-containing protein [Bacteroides sp.]MCM1548605.1 prepilin-type N-terminal cleavage/methylation domain-containing protein [Clostridium sp.]